MYGCSQSVVYMREFREVLCDVFGMTGRAALFGFSRGGLYAFRYAVTWPEDVLALYLDAPVLDIRQMAGRQGGRDRRSGLLGGVQALVLPG